jgi:HEAT repeat protein
MVITMKQVLELLNPDETDYVKAVKLGREAIPHLEILVKKSEPMLASKAAYLASLIQDKRSVNILVTAAQSKEPAVRLAAAAGCRHLSFADINHVLDLLKNDEDEGVRNKALRIERLRSN